MSQGKPPKAGNGSGGRAEGAWARGSSAAGDIDVSGSMRGDRIENATNNALKVFDTFTSDEDAVGLAWFNHHIHSKFVLKPRAKVNRALGDEAQALSPSGSGSRRARRSTAPSSAQRATRRAA